MDSMVDSKGRNQSKISQKRNSWTENWEADVLPLNYSRNLFIKGNILRPLIWVASAAIIRTQTGCANSKFGPWARRPTGVTGKGLEGMELRSEMLTGGVVLGKL
jgi:hypothetical protein